MGASGRPCGAGVTVRCTSVVGVSTTSTTVDFVDGAVTGVAPRFVGVTARLPRSLAAVRAENVPFGVGAVPSTRSDAETTSTRLPELPASCTSPPPALARSCSRSALTEGCSDELEHAAAPTSRRAAIEYRREYLIVIGTPECQKGAIDTVGIAGARPTPEKVGDRQHLFDDVTPLGVTALRRLPDY